MPKRSCPFEDEFVPQLKIHVNEKIAASTNKSSLKEVYRKTLDKLFKGANSKCNKEKDTDEQDEVVVLYDCNMCKSQANNVSKCWFCENKLCNNCEKICNFCKEIFCSSCSLVIYNENLETTCLNCLSN